MFHIYIRKYIHIYLYFSINPLFVTYYVKLGPIYQPRGDYREWGIIISIRPNNETSSSSSRVNVKRNLWQLNAVLCRTLSLSVYTNRVRTRERERESCRVGLRREVIENYSRRRSSSLVLCFIVKNKFGLICFSDVLAATTTPGNRNNLPLF